MKENKEFISDYLRALSGNPKPAELVARYVADDDLAQHIAECEAAFPLYELLPEDIIAERDVVTVRGTFRGVQRGLFAGIEPTGHMVTGSLIIIYRLQDGKIVEHWMEMNTASLLQQLKEPLLAAAE
jgi:predicted ester cyclase